MEIGAHTRSHPRLTQCNDAQLRTKSKAARPTLEDHLGNRSPSSAIPMAT
jgi:peptidoglycan/xylan/chitin deacetylase (PgdA/CDA1 family)